MTSTRKQVYSALAIGGAIILLLAGIKGVQIWRAIAQHSHFTPPPEAVTSITAAEETWSRELTAVGSLAATQGVLLSVKEGGEVNQVDFESGQKVEAGSVLVKLDASVEEADLVAAQATLRQAELAFKRVESLRGKSAMSEAEYDSAWAKLHEAQAKVDSLKATITRKRVVAPFSGRAGIRMVNVGQYVTPGMPIVPVYSLDPLYVNFSLPQQSIRELQVGQPVRITVDAFPGESFSGTLTAVNPQINPTTRAVELQATIPNPDERLRPGMFVDVSVVLPIEDRFIVLPASSIGYAPYGDTVYVIETMKAPDGSDYRGVRLQIVELGPKRGDRVAVVKGLQPGQEIVTSGVFKLRPNQSVMVNNNFAPTDNPNPKDS